MTTTPNSSLTSGSYAIIRKRIQTQADELRARLQQLNTARKAVFGATETSLIANDRINTANYCLARGLVAIGEYGLLGYNVHIGLRSGIQLSDVFSVYRFSENRFQEQDLSLLDNEKFATDFQNLYRYYKDAYFARFAIRDRFLFMVFHLTPKGSDFKTFKWLITDTGLQYIDNRSDHELNTPEQYEFRWKRVGRDDQRSGLHPHMSILDRVFVETVGGDLTIKVEDNTDDGKGIYREAVEYSDQSLDDGEFHFADLGNLIALRIRPYQEEDRYFIFNDRLQTVERVDALGRSGVLLPDQQGLLFANGYYLQTGEYKLFDHPVQDLRFDKRIVSANGEDYLFVFYAGQSGTFVLLHYNMVEQTVATPIVCHGYTLFPEGELCYFRSESEPTKHHVVQIWQTPFASTEQVSTEQADNYLYKVGNKDIVRAMAESNEILTLSAQEDNYAGLYTELVKRITDVLDSYYWIDKPESFQLHQPLQDLRQTAQSAIEEFEKKIRTQKQTNQSIQAVQKKATQLFDQIRRQSFDQVDAFVQLLAALRSLRGEIVSLQDLPYTQPDLIDSLDEEAKVAAASLANDCIDFLLQEDALQPYQQRIQEAATHIDGIETALAAKELTTTFNAIGEELELLIEIVSNLPIDDATQTTRIIDQISALFTHLNQHKSAIKQKQQQLQGTEAAAEFGVQIKLLDQSMINYLDLADSPEKVDTYLTRLMVQLEELEGKFAEIDEFVSQLADKREEVFAALEQRKNSLIEARNNRTTSLAAAAERILNGIQQRSLRFQDAVEINGFFASDLLISKVRDIIDTLKELDDSNKANSIQTRLKTLQEEALLQLRDRKDLFVEGENVLKMGKHHFSVNVQPLELTLVQQQDRLWYHLTGTNFYSELQDDLLATTRSVWKQDLISENEAVYRAEYLAYALLQDPQFTAKSTDFADLLPQVSKLAAARYSEGYTKGIHDEDATRILAALLRMQHGIGLLRFTPLVRACAQMFWHRFLDTARRELLQTQLKSAGKILEVFPDTHEFDYLEIELLSDLVPFLEETRLFPAYVAEPAAAYLFRELAADDRFVCSADADHHYQHFVDLLKKKKAWAGFRASLQELTDRPREQYLLARKWVHAYLETQTASTTLPYLEEITTLLIVDDSAAAEVHQLSTHESVSPMRGDHAVIEDGVYHLDFHAFMGRLERYVNEVVPVFEQFVKEKKRLTKAFQENIGLDEFKPRVLSSFVRNQLIDQVYLPLIGDNLAKQIGTADEKTRTDRMGMLLLISPPGYGKTTLMEYVANRLGLIFVKVNGPAIGHHVTSLAPADAPSLAAKKELEKLNLAFEMGDNIMLYVDDIQHCHPEFLQKFISLCDAQRKIEGVYQGKAKTYDLRGRRVAVVMAGNPYTETGERFRIPDMLANRSDIYNLGDVIGDSHKVFQLSYLENALTSNPVLSSLLKQNREDIYALIQAVESDDMGSLQLKGDYKPEDVAEYVSVLQKMIRIRNAVLAVNQEYIRSAGTADAFRTEPTFKLQGSYRNMNKLAEKIAPIMNEQEVETLLLAHYEGEAQTLTADAEANMLKLKALLGVQTPSEKQRWQDILDIFQQQQSRQHQGNHLATLSKEMGSLTEEVTGIRKALAKKNGKT